MKILLLTGFDPTAQYLFDYLEPRHNISVLKVVWARPEGGSVRKVREKTASEFCRRFLRRVSRLSLDRYYRELHRRLEQELPEVTESGAVRQVQAVISASSFQDDSCVRELRKHAPDVIVVNGAPLIPEEALRVARLATINLHFGIAPEYRGSHTLFWPMLRGDWDHLGATIHFVSPELDGGAVLARLFPSLTSTDDEASIMAKCTRMAARTIDTILRSLEHGTVDGGMLQDAGGRTFRRSERTRWHDWLYRIKRALGFRPPSRLEFEQRYWKENVG